MPRMRRFTLPLMRLLNSTKNHSQVVIENLSGLASMGAKKRRRSRFNRMLNRAQYQKLQKVLSYKLAVAGLPAAREVHPSYTSQACPLCGSISAENRLKTATSDGVTHEFKCVSCGFSDDADLNAARNIALKRLWRDGLSPALRTASFNEVPENKSFLLLRCKCPLLAQSGHSAAGRRR